MRLAARAVEFIGIFSVIENRESIFIFFLNDVLCVQKTFMSYHFDFDRQECRASRLEE